jgi:hypothetical protein
LPQPLKTKAGRFSQKRNHLLSKLKAMPRPILFALVCILCLYNCGPQKTVSNSEQTNTVKNLFDTSSIVILPYDTSLYWICRDCKPAELTSQDFENIENLLIKCIDEYNPEQEKRFREIKSKYPEQNFEISQFTIDLKRYNRQYIAMTNINGEKVVWINCVCDTYNDDWRKVPIIVNDGGNCFFKLNINLTKRSYFELSVNGEA